LSFLIVHHRFQFINGGDVRVGRKKLLVELCFEVVPVQKLGVTFVFFFPLKIQAAHLVALLAFI
jgi:hypothetical protein